LGTQVPIRVSERAPPLDAADATRYEQRDQWRV
jgi:hypothetical protein